jgi:hypothetical protein
VCDSIEKPLKTTTTEGISVVKFVGAIAIQIKKSKKKA